MNPELLAMLSEAATLFVWLGLELTLLFLVISFLVGVLQEWIPAKRVQATLGASGGRGYFWAAMLGGLTPFCSCSTIPMLAGLLKARASFGPVITFLLTSPLLNPIVLGLFLVTFGLEVTLFYATFALSVAIAMGYLLASLGFDRYIRPGVFGRSPSCAEPAVVNGNADSTGCCSQVQPSGVSIDAGGCCVVAPVVVAPLAGRWLRIWQESWSQFTRLMPYLFVGVALGAFTYGFLPTELIARYAGADNPLAIPVAAVVGVPLYIRAATVIPLSAALVAKGMSMGAVMALIIGSAGASLTEVVLLRSLFRWQMIAVFVAVIFGMAVVAGYGYQLVF
ncbi:permease [Simiduia agarivorans]|uniref:Permease n=1 Tax=Simiduia agarivorans (strain DSM 21679 / JCM 13881 / BCRC 17597 / SA1) TaxID=1117647 RepID=K4KE05_SIMAS|nr:permease [Simiduia agarivorans]AFU97259.1 permease [Simiduia agarivorans SA1 = DSM 21679]